MPEGLSIAFFGSSLLSAYWNGAATYYRGIIRALAARGHRVTFYEPDAFDRQQHRDIEAPDYACSVVYPASDPTDLRPFLEAAAEADILVKTSGIGVFDDFLVQALLEHRTPRSRAVYWDVDAPATLTALGENPDDPLRTWIPEYDAVFTYGGGPHVVNGYLGLGARSCLPIYNALDPSTHFRVRPDARFAGALGFLGNRLPDREARVEEFFFKPARAMPGEVFVLGGNGWTENAPQLDNVRYCGHVYTREHNAFYSSPRVTLNVNRASMAETGYSPATRIFEAAGAGSCVVTDFWEGLDAFLEPERECLVARNGDEVRRHLEMLTPERAATIGEHARRRVLAEHVYSARAAQVEEALVQLFSMREVV